MVAVFTVKCINTVRMPLCCHANATLRSLIFWALPRVARAKSCRTTIFRWRARALRIGQSCCWTPKVPPLACGLSCPSGTWSRFVAGTSYFAGNLLLGRRTDGPIHNARCGFNIKRHSRRIPDEPVTMLFMFFLSVFHCVFE